MAGTFGMGASISYFKLDFGLCNVLVTSAPPSYLLGFSNLRSDGLETKSVSVYCKAGGVLEETYVRIEIFQGKTFHGVDAELRAWLHNGEASGHYHDFCISVQSSRPRNHPHRLPGNANLHPSVVLHFTLCLLTEKLLASATFLDYLNKSRLQLLNGRHMVC